MAIGLSLDIPPHLCYSVLNFITEDILKQIKTFWQAVREFWQTGKTGIALFLISFFALIYGYIAMEFEITQGWKGHVSIQNVLKDVSAFIPVGGAFVATIIGGIDIIMLLSDFIQARREKRIEAAKIEGKVEGIAEGIAEGKAEGIVEGIAEGKIEGKIEGIAEGKAEGIVEGIAKGRDEGEARAYREWTEWDRRRKEAEARGEAFTEPSPTQPQEQSQEKPKE